MGVFIVGLIVCVGLMLGWIGFVDCFFRINFGGKVLFIVGVCFMGFFVLLWFMLGWEEFVDSFCRI